MLIMILWLYGLIGMVAAIYNFVAATHYYPYLGYKVWLRGALLSWLFWLPALLYLWYIHLFNKEKLDDCPHCQSHKDPVQ